MKKLLLSVVFFFALLNGVVIAQISSFPYVENFDSDDGGWTVDPTNSGTWALGSPAATLINSADSGDSAWVTNLTGNYNNNENGNVISPVFDLSTLVTPSIQLSIWWNSEFSWDGTVLQSSIDGGTSWQNVGAFGDANNWYNDNSINGNPGGQADGWSGRGTTGSGGWVVARHSLDGLGGQTNVIFRVAFGSDGSVQDEGVAFDSVSIFEVTCQEPSGITIDAITENSANISWVPVGSETVWEIAIQNDGTGVPTGLGLTTTNNDPYSAVALTPSTAYEVYLRSDCGTDGYSSWVGPFDFTTLNTPPPPPLGVNCASGTSSFIFTENFEQDPPSGWTGTGFDGSNGNWDITAADANSVGTGPANAYNGGTGNHLEYEATGNSTNIASAISPAIDLSVATDSAELSFFFHAFGEDIGTLNVGIANDVAGPFTSIFTWVGDLQTSEDEAWVPVGVNLDAYLGQIIYLEFSYGGAGSGFEGDIAVDFVRVESCGSFCIAPSTITVANVTGTSAEISWTPNNGETSWEYVVTVAGTGEPVGPGTTTTIPSASITGLEFQTEYEVWVRANCGSEFSIWAGPENFTTTIQSQYLIDCTQVPTNITYCYENNDATNWTFTSSDGSPLRLIFNAGGIESCCDDILIYDGIDDTGALIYQGNNGGDLAGLTFDSTGDSMYFEIDSDGSVSCASGSGCCTAQWDFTVSCATCVNPEATYEVVSNCQVGPEFFVNVDLTSLGSATSVTVSDNQASASQTLAAAGNLQFGPYTNNTPVQITIANDDDANCQISSPSLTQELCLDTVVDCSAGPVAAFLCYGNNDSDILSYTSTNGLPLNLTINTGEIEGAPFDFLLVTDGNGTVLYNDEGNDGVLDGLTFQSITDTITIQILSDGSVSCESNSFCCSDGIDYTVACATCINPAATYQIVDDCDNGDQFLIDVNVTTLGDANSLTISNNIDASVVPVTATGIYQIGPFPFAIDVIVTLSNDDDINCVVNSNAIQLLACPPVNDNPCGAIVAAVNSDETCNMVTQGTVLEATDSGVPSGSCGGNPDDDVWFEFVALGEQQVISILNISGGTFNIDHAVYEGVCDNLTEIYCSNDDISVTPSLVIGNTYYVRVFSGGGNSETSTFDLCINTLAPPTFCLEALPICALDINYPSITGDEVAPPFLDYGCLGSQPDPTWSAIYFDLPGDYTFSLAQTGLDGLGNDIDFIVWGPFNNQQDACYELLPETIADCSFSATSIETITLNNVQAGDIYLILITNFSQQEGFFTFTQLTGPDNGTNCEVVCDVEVLYQDVAVSEDANNIGFSTPIELCGVDSIVVEASSPYADTYQWYSQNGIAIDGATDPILTITESGNYFVVASGEVCDGDSFSIQVIVTLGDESVANDAPDMITCDDVSADGFEEFNLSDQTADVLGTQDPANFNVTYHSTLADAQLGLAELPLLYTNTSNPQTIYVRVEDSDAGFCSATSNFDLIISGPTPVATSVAIEECDDDTDGIALFDLTANDVNILNGQSDTDFIVRYFETELEAEAGNSGEINTSNLYSSSSQTIFARVESVLAFDCYATIAFDLIVKPLPITVFTSDFEYEVCPNASVPILITATPENYSENEVSIVWYRDGGVIDGENSLTLPVIEAGLYEIEVSFNDESMCSAITPQPIIELSSCVIPQGISPNGDGLNDTFDLSSFNVTKLEIYNRNGTLVYSKRNYTDEWHGQTNDGEELPVGTYFYTLEYEEGKQKAAWVYIQRLN